MVVLLAAGAYPTTGGLSASDLIAMLSIVVIVFGLLLTAIGVLVLRNFNSFDARLVEQRGDFNKTVGEIHATIDQSVQRIHLRVDTLQTDLTTIRSDLSEVKTLLHVGRWFEKQDN